MSLAQIPINLWPPDLTEEVAVLEQEPEDMERSGSVKFEKAHDDLDYFKAAVVVPAGGRSFALKRYQNSPLPGVGLIVAKAPPAELRLQLRDALKALGIELSCVTWARYDLAG